MCDSNNVNEHKSYLPKVHAAYDDLISLCSNLSECDFVPSTLPFLSFQYIRDYKITVQE